MTGTYLTNWVVYTSDFEIVTLERLASMTEELDQVECS